MPHFDTTRSILSYSEIFRLPGPVRICWPSQLGQNCLSPRRSISASVERAVSRALRTIFANAFVEEITSQ